MLVVWAWMCLMLAFDLWDTISFWISTKNNQFTTTSNCRPLERAEGPRLIYGTWTWDIGVIWVGVEGVEGDTVFATDKPRDPSGIRMVQTNPDLSDSLLLKRSPSPLETGADSWHSFLFCFPFDFFLSTLISCFCCFWFLNLWNLLFSVVFEEDMIDCILVSCWSGG